MKKEKFSDRSVREEKRSQLRFRGAERERLAAEVAADKSYELVIPLSLAA